MAQENYDYKAALAVEKFLGMKRENRTLNRKIEANKESMKELLEEFPQIGTIKGILRKEKPGKRKERTPDTTPSTPTSTTTAEMETGEETEPPKKKQKSTKQALDATLKKAEAGRSPVPRQQSIRKDTKTKGGQEFHASSGTNPPRPTPEKDD